MVDGKFRPQIHELGVDESGTRKLEITIDLGEPGDKAVQVRLWVNLQPSCTCVNILDIA